MRNEATGIWAEGSGGGEHHHTIIVYFKTDFGFKIVVDTETQKKTLINESKQLSRLLLILDIIIILQTDWFEVFHILQFCPRKYLILKL